MTKPKLPASPEAEQGIIGSVMNSDKAWNLVVESGVTADTFLDDRNRILFTAFKDITTKSLPLDLITITEHLHSHSLMDKCGGVAYLQECIDKTPTSAHVEHYISIASQKELLRNTYREATRIAQEATDGKLSMSAEMLRANAEATFSGLNNKCSGRREHITFSELTSKVQDRIVASAEGRSPIGLKTGWKFIDDCSGGLLEGGLWVVTGAPKSCKTTLARSIITQIAKRNVRVAVKTTEVTQEQYTEAIMAEEARVYVSELHKEKVNEKYLQRFLDAGKIVAELPIDISDGVVTASQVKSWYKQAVVNGAKVVLMDYLQQTMPETPAEERSDEKRVSNISAVLRDMARSTLVPCIAVSSLSKDGSMRYSGSIEYDCTLLIRMKQDENYHYLDNPRYTATIERSRFSASDMSMPLYYWCGRLITESEWNAIRDCADF